MKQQAQTQFISAIRIHKPISPAHIQNKQTKSIERRHNFSTQIKKEKLLPYQLRTSHDEDR